MSQRSFWLLFALCGATYLFPLLNAYPATGESAQLSADVTPGCDLQELTKQVKAAANQSERLRQDELRRVAERAERCPGAELIRAQALHSRATCYGMESAMEEAESFYRQTVALLEKSPGGEVLLAVTLVDLGAIYMRMSRLDDAWHSAQRAIRLLEDYAPNHRSHRARADLLLARVHVERAQLSKAKRFYRKVIANLSSEDPGLNADPFLLVALLNYSQLVLHTDPSESEKALNLVVAMLHGKDSDRIVFKAWVLIARGRLEYFHGKSASGLSTAVEGLKLARSALPPEHFFLAELNAAVGEVFFLSRNYVEAEALFAQAVQTWNTQATQSELTYVTLDYYAKLLRKIGKKDAAKAMARRLRDMDKSKNGLRRANTIDVMTMSSPMPAP